MAVSVVGVGSAVAAALYVSQRYRQEGSADGAAKGDTDAEPAPRSLGSVGPQGSRFSIAVDEPGTREVRHSPLYQANDPDFGRGYPGDML